MEEEEVFSEKTLSGEEYDSDQLGDTENLESEEVWEDVRPEESASQITRNTDSDVNTGSEMDTSDIIDASTITGSAVWLYFDKNPSYATGYNVCRKCSKKYNVSTSVTTLRIHLITHQLRVPTRKQKAIVKKKNPFDEEDQNRHDEFLIQWLICDLQPFTVVENDQFQAFVNFFCSRYIIPDRHKVKGKVLLSLKYLMFLMII